jgi:hypothetical protein
MHELKELLRPNSSFISKEEEKSIRFSAPTAQTMIKKREATTLIPVMMLGGKGGEGGAQVEGEGRARVRDRNRRRRRKRRRRKRRSCLGGGGRGVGRWRRCCRTAAALTATRCCSLRATRGAEAEEEEEAVEEEEEEEAVEEAVAAALGSHCSARERSCQELPCTRSRAALCMCHQNIIMSYNMYDISL